MSIASEITRLQGAKADLKTAIESKGITVSSSAKLDDYPALVDQFYDRLLTPYRFDYNAGYVTGGQFVYEYPTNTFCDIYEVLGNHTYVYMHDEVVGTRSRWMFTTTDVTTTQSTVTGIQILDDSTPDAMKGRKYTAPEDGFIIVAKDNQGTTGLKTFVFDIT